MLWLQLEGKCKERDEPRINAGYLHNPAEQILVELRDNAKRKDKLIFVLSRVARTSSLLKAIRPDLTQRNPSYFGVEESYRR